MTLGMISGSTIDYRVELIKAAFVVAGVWPVSESHLLLLARSPARNPPLLCVAVVPFHWCCFSLLLLGAFTNYGPLIPWSAIKWQLPYNIIRVVLAPALSISCDDAPEIILRDIALLHAFSRCAALHVMARLWGCC